MDDNNFQERLKKLYDDHARVMTLIESRPPPTERQKQESAKLRASQRRVEAERQQKFAKEAQQAGQQSDGSEKIFPPLPWRPKMLLRLSSLHWRANIELCKRIHF